MDKQNNDNVAYMNFVQNLNEILNNYNISLLNCS